MAESLCNLQHKKKGSNRKRGGGDECMGNFPNSKEIAGLEEESLNEECKLGYRASIIIELARNIENGSLKMEDFQTPIPTSHHKLLRDRLIKIKGFGPFIVANILMCIGFYQQIPVDTETIKHLEQVHQLEKSNCRKEHKKVIAKIYDKYEPFQCLAYWMERVEYYEKNVGKLSELPHSKICNVTSTNFQINISADKE